MKINLLGIKGTWREIANAANTTINKEAGENEPSSHWKKRMLLCEHSPIRQLSIKAKWYDLMYWVSVHLVRHKIGIEHWVRSQRPDRMGIILNRNNESQSALIEHEIEANAQAIINISRKRLCKMAMPETREAWVEFLMSFKDRESELYEACVPNCIYQGYCYEFRSCGYHKTDSFQKELLSRRNGINN